MIVSPLQLPQGTAQGTNHARQSHWTIRVKVPGRRFATGPRPKRHREGLRPYQQAAHQADHPAARKTRGVPGQAWAALVLGSPRYRRELLASAPFEVAVAPAHGLGECSLPKGRGVLEPAERNIHDSEQHLHVPLRILRCAEGASRDRSAVSGEARNLAPVAIGLTLTACIAMGGPLTGASLNPARSLGPALFSDAPTAFSSLWIYFIACPVGGGLAALVHKFLSSED